MKWIVGLGNPGRRYEQTRHNVGFMALDWFANKWGFTINHNKCKARIGEGQVNGMKVTLIKPDTFMNLSGESVRAFMDFYKADIEDMIVVYDDLDTMLGRIRLRYQGSPGGHNGIRSLIQHTGTQVFNRVRIGISRPEPRSDIADYVLSSFAKTEWPEVKGSLELTSEALEHALQHSFDNTMAKFNSI